MRRETISTSDLLLADRGRSECLSERNVLVGRRSIPRKPADQCKDLEQDVRDTLDEFTAFQTAD